MKKRVLFLCPGNSCSSQMAEGLLRHFHGDEYEVFSAGVKPIEVNKNAVQVMNEIGVDISRQTSKHINEFLNQEFDIIITLCCDSETTFPNIFAKAQTINWKFYDPAEGIETQKDLLAALREVRDGIKEKIDEHFKSE